MNLTVFLEIVDRVLKSWWTVIAGICVGLAASTGAMIYLPKTYEAQTTIFVVPPQMPERLVPSTVTDDMSTRLSALQEAVISRPYMVQLISTTYGEPEDSLELDRMVKSIGRRVDVSLMRIDARRGGGMFRLSFLDENPERAANVVNTLARLYIDQNVQFRTNQAKATVQTIKDLADEVEIELLEVEREIAAFKEEHLYDTSEHFDANLQQMTASRQELETNNRALIQAEDSLRALLLQQEQADFLATSMPDAIQPLDPTSAQLTRLRGELADLRSRYHEDHPDIKRKKKELNDFLADNAAIFKVDGEGEGADVQAPATLLSTQIDITRREIERRKAEAIRIQRDIDEYKRRIERTPRIDQELAELSKNYEVLQEKYRDYMEKYEDARAALRIEESQQGERFEIIEAALPPAVPVKPVPLVVYGMGLMVGLVIFVGPSISKHFLIPTVMSESGLEELSDLPILTTIGRLETPAIEREQRRRKLGNIVASVLFVSAFAAVAILYFWNLHP
jgi:polysaccharide chain length determinant protein (PEP-CTERM system associated)